MTKTEIIALARESGMSFHLGMPHEAVTEQLMRFADLVAAKEREECAKEGDHWFSINKSHRCGDYIAAAIRARSKADLSDLSPLKGIQGVGL